MNDAINQTVFEKEISDIRHCLQKAHDRVHAGESVDLSPMGAMVEALTVRLQANASSFAESERMTMVAGLNDLVAGFDALESALVIPGETVAGQEDTT